MPEAPLFPPVPGITLGALGREAEAVRPERRAALGRGEVRGWFQPEAAFTVARPNGSFTHNATIVPLGMV